MKLNHCQQMISISRFSDSNIPSPRRLSLSRIPVADKRIPSEACGIWANLSRIPIKFRRGQSLRGWHADRGGGGQGG